MPRNPKMTMADKAERNERIAELTRQGLTAKVIAEKLNITRRSVVRIRAAMGVAQPAPQRMTADELARAEALLVDGASVTEAARTIGRCDQALRKHFPQYAWSPSQAAELAVLVQRAKRLLPGL